MTQIVKTNNQVRDLMNSDAVKSKFAEMLGAKSAGFLVSVMNCVNSNDLLKNAEPNSILFAAATAASLDLPVNQNLGFAYIIPYNQKQSDGTYIQVAQFQLGYKGFIQLSQRSGQFQTINATDVKEGEIKHFNRLTGEIDFEWKDNRTELKTIGYVAYFKLINGFEKSLYMTVDELKAHGAKFSKTFKQQYGLWNTDFDAMASKTVTKLLLAKFAPLSVDMQKAVTTDQAIVKDWDSQEVEYVDNQEVPLDIKAVAESKTNKRIEDFIASAKDLPTLEQASDKLQTQAQKDLYTAKYEELSK
jgi:recombination protein RecT